MCATQVFSNIGKDQFNRLVQKASEMQIHIAGDAGTVAKDGVTIRWKHDPVAQTLELQVTSLPFFVSCGLANRMIHDLVDGATHG